MQDAVIVSSVRTAVGKSGRGTLATARPDDLAATAIEGAFARVPQLEKSEVEDVVLGCAHPEAEQGMNVARIASLRAGLPVEVSAMTVNRFCASGLQAIAQAADRIRGGGASVVVAGGTESMSMIPMGGHKISANPWLVDHLPATYLSMGLTAERVSERYGVSREDADAFALASHNKAVEAIAAGRFTEEIVPYEWTERVPKNGSGKVAEQKRSFSVDEGPRSDTSAVALSNLKPAFHSKGTVTAGNSSQTSDGAAATILMSSERAASLGMKPMARFLGYATAGCSPEIMGIGPVHAVPKALKLAGLKLEDIGLVELNEAFAAQSLAVIRQLGLNPEIVNVNGGAIALGHPLGCTGAKLTATLLHEMRRRNIRYGLVTMCVGGGMGAAGIFENLN